MVCLQATDTRVTKAIRFSRTGAIALALGAAFGIPVTHRLMRANGIKIVYNARHCAALMDPALGEPKFFGTDATQDGLTTPLIASRTRDSAAVESIGGRSGHWRRC